LPTATHEFAEVHATPLSLLVCAPAGAGTVCTVQDVPFHSAAADALEAVPTASHELAETHETALSPTLGAL
jgi:hypothetical protein